MPEYSIIVPVYNRPNEISELLTTLGQQIYKDFEVIVIEDGSVQTSEHVVKSYQDILGVKYFYLDNCGPALARNFGATKANGKWLIFLDSDCFVDPTYLQVIHSSVDSKEISAFGGPDRDHDSFSTIQKGISYAMTSFFTTGGIRGKSKSLEKFNPRSFNMGVKREDFSRLGGFRNMRFGEDIDLSLRMHNANYSTILIPEAYTYHKRRSTFWQFYKQIYNSGVARILLWKLHPGSLKVVHFLPFLFVLSNFMLWILLIIDLRVALLIVIYPLSVLLDALLYFKSFKVAVVSLIAAYIQLFAYGIGFVHALFQRRIKHRFENNLYD